MCEQPENVHIENYSSGFVTKNPGNAELFNNSEKLIACNKWWLSFLFLHDLKAHVRHEHERINHHEYIIQVGGIDDFEFGVVNPNKPGPSSAQPNSKISTAHFNQDQTKQTWNIIADANKKDCEITINDDDANVNLVCICYDKIFKPAIMGSQLDLTVAFPTLENLRNVRI